VLSTDYDGGRRVRQLNAELLRQLEPARHEFVSSFESRMVATRLQLRHPKEAVPKVFFL